MVNEIKEKQKAFCPYCNGTGKNKKDKTCKKCKGKGYVVEGETDSTYINEGGDYTVLDDNNGEY